MLYNGVCHSALSGSLVSESVSDLLACGRAVAVIWLRAQKKADRGVNRMLVGRGGREYKSDLKN